MKSIYIWINGPATTDPTDAELRLADFAGAEESLKPSASPTDRPSTSPTDIYNYEQAYIVQYAGEIRTVVRHPFQIDSTGEVLPMDGSQEFELCGVEEVEGIHAHLGEQNALRFLIEGVCVDIRRGNPTVRLLCLCVFLIYRPLFLLEKLELYGFISRALFYL